MLRIFLLDFWPVLIPLLLYVLWLFYSNKKAEEGQEIKFGTGPFLPMVYAMLAIGFACFLYMFATMEANQENYVRPHITEDGQHLAPGLPEQ